MRLKSWNGKVAVITGASSGIGRLLAIQAAEKGATAVLVARNEERLRCVEREIVAAGGRTDVVPCDVADRTAVLSAAETIVGRHGRVDVLMNNAGFGHHANFIDLELDEMERLIQVNLLGSVYWTKALLPQMVARQSGWIVFVASVAGKIAVPDESVYCATKFAMLGLAASVSMEVEAQGVHVLTVCPGAVNTAFFTEAMIARMPPVARRTMIAPEAVAGAVMRALAAGKREITVPRSIAFSYLIQAAFPRFMRHMVKRVALRAR
jgi:short-subunit dehydrogenase